MAAYPVFVYVVSRAGRQVNCLLNPAKRLRFLHTHVKVTHLGDAELSDVLKQEESTLLIDSRMLIFNTVATMQGKYKNYSLVYNAEVSAAALRWW